MTRHGVFFDLVKSASVTRRVSVDWGDLPKSPDPTLEDAVLPKLSVKQTAVVSTLLLMFSVGGQASDFHSQQLNAVQRFFESYARHDYRYLSEISGAQLDELVAGRVIVKVLDAPDDSVDTSRIGVIGLKIVEAPRLLVWLALTTDSEELDGRLTRAVLDEGPAGSIVRYQHIDLPWPIRDRHWVIRVENNIDIADASSGLVWERRWELHAHGKKLIDSAHANGTIVGLTRRSLDRSVYLPTNRGSWTLVDLGNGTTLVSAYADVKLGGLFPDGLVRSFTKRELRAGLTALESLIPGSDQRNSLFVKANRLSLAQVLRLN